MTQTGDVRTSDLALSTGDMTKIGIGIIVGIVVLGLLIGLLITAIVVRVLLAVVVIGAAVFVWHQRSAVLDHVTNKHTCQLRGSFFGLHVQAPADVRRVCRSVRGG